MKVVIVEDEKLATKKLTRLLKEINPETKVISTLDSVEDSVNWFSENSWPDLVFMDIQLEDGICFEIFENVEMNTPIIFTTAFDQYAINAFKQNSVDYLLKPINKQELEGALAKFNDIHFEPKALAGAMETKVKERFLVKIGDRFKSVQSTDISLIYIEEKCNFILTNEGKRFAIDYSLDKLETLIDRNLFYRINRTTIVNYHLIDEIFSYSNSRLKLKIKNNMNTDVLVSRERVASFKRWMDR